MHSTVTAAQVMPPPLAVEAIVMLLAALVIVILEPWVNVAQAGLPPVCAIMTWPFVPVLPLIDSSPDVKTILPDVAVILPNVDVILVADVNTLDALLREFVVVAIIAPIMLRLSCLLNRLFPM